jgi:hypothetical protein
MQMQSANMPAAPLPSMRNERLHRNNRAMELRAGELQHQTGCDHQNELSGVSGTIKGWNLR